MKKILVIFAALGLAVAYCTPRVEAADSDTISVTVTITQALSVTVSPGTWAVTANTVGTTESTWASTNPGHFTASNDGNGAENLNISVADSADWTAGASADADQFAMGWGAGSDPYTIEPTYTNITTGGVPLTTNLGSGTDFRFDLQIQLPTSTTAGGAEQTITVTVTAVTP